MTDTALTLAQRASDVRGDRVVLLRGTAIVATGYAVGASLQAAYVYSQVVPEWGEVALWRRFAANTVGVVVLVAMLWLMRVYRARSFVLLVLGGAVGSVVACVARWFGQVALRVYVDPVDSTRDTELLGGFVVCAISAGIGAWSLVARRRARSRIRASERRTVHTEMAVAALEQEEVRVRRQVAEGLHGTLQSKLVVVDARLAQVLDSPHLSAADDEALRWIRGELDEVREIDVRQMSRLLYPERLELGLVPAVRALLGRLPSTIATRLDVADEVRRIDDPAGTRVSVSERLLAVRIVEEGITNALKHGPATTVRVCLGIDGAALVVRVENDGDLYDPQTGGPESGTARLRERLELVGGTVLLAPGDGVGAELQGRIPLATLAD